MNEPTVAEAYRTAIGDLAQIATPGVSGTQNLLDEAIARRDAEAIRREGHTWSGRVGLSILELADAIDRDEDS